MTSKMASVIVLTLVYLSACGTVAKTLGTMSSCWGTTEEPFHRNLTEQEMRRARYLNQELPSLSLRSMPITVLDGRRRPPPGTSGGRCPPGWSCRPKSARVSTWPRFMGTVWVGTVPLGFAGSSELFRSEPWAPTGWWSTAHTVIATLRWLGNAFLGWGCEVYIRCFLNSGPHLAMMGPGPYCAAEVLCRGGKTGEALFLINETVIANLTPGYRVHANWPQTLGSPIMRQYIKNLTDLRGPWERDIVREMAKNDSVLSAWVMANATGSSGNFTISCQVWIAGPLTASVRWNRDDLYGVPGTRASHGRWNVTVWNVAYNVSDTDGLQCDLVTFKWNASVTLPWNGPPPFQPTGCLGPSREVPPMAMARLHPSGSPALLGDGRFGPGTVVIFLGLAVGLLSIVGLAWRRRRVRLGELQNRSPRSFVRATMVIDSGDGTDEVPSEMIFVSQSDRL